METGRWNGHIFVVSPTLIRGFTELTLKAASEVKEKESGNQKYVARKNGKPVEVTMTITLNATTGCNVREEAMEFAKDAVNGKADYMYVGGKKIAACKLMLIEANVSEISIAPNGQWVSCQIQLSFRQSTKFSGSTTSGSSGGSIKKSSGNGASKKTDSVTSKYYTTRLSTLANTASTSAAERSIKEKTIRAGKAASAAKITKPGSKLYFLDTKEKRNTNYVN